MRENNPIYGTPLSINTRKTPADDSGNNGYELPVGGETLGCVKNGGNVVINADGTMDAPASAGNTPVATVEPADDDIPKVYFTVKGGMPFTKAEGDVQVFMRYISKTATIERHCTAKVQGGSSADNQAYKKRNWTIKVYKDGTYEKKDKLSFKGWPAMNKFVLKAGWVIPGHLRNVGAAKIWGQIMRSRSDYDALPEELRNSPNQGATDGFHVRVFINGMYWGIYDWIVAKDQLFGQDNGNPAHSILNSEWNNQPTCAFSTTAPTVSGNWSEELLDDMTAETKISMENWIKFVAGSTNEEFVANAENYFDVQSVIDAICFDRIIMPVDNLCRNQIVFKYAEKWFMGKWDLDAILGLPPVAGQGWFPYNTAYQKGYVAYRDFGINNMLYDRTEKLFLERFKENYWRLRKGPLSEANLVEVFGRLSDRLRSIEGLLAEENASTTGNGQFTAMPNVKTDTIQQIREFVSKRCAFMDEEVENMSGESGEGGETPDTPDTPETVPCTGISLDKSTLTFTEEIPQALIVTVTPDGCTDSVVWSSDNENVAVVNGGLVTPMMDGSCNITATCGNYSENCAVTVADGLFGDSAQLVTLVNGVGSNASGGRVYSNTNGLANIVGAFPTSPWGGFGTSDYTEIKEGFDLIEVVGETTKIAFYDSAKKLISCCVGQNGNTLICDIPDGTVYFRFCVSTTGMTTDAVSVRYGYVADHKIEPTWKDGNAYTISADGSIADGDYYMTERVEIPDGVTTILMDSRSHEKYREYIYAVYDADGNLLTRRADWMTNYHCFKCNLSGLENPSYAYFGMKNPASGVTGIEKIEGYAF